LSCENACSLELRVEKAVHAAATGQPASTYTNAIAPGSLIKAIDLTEMRSFLDAARAVLPGIPAIQYTDPSLAAGARIKAPHIQELRNGVK
jgi:hypothetical protein